MITKPNASGVRHALREATMVNHQRVDDLFSHFSLDDAESYGSFLKAHARALPPLEALVCPDSPRLPMLMQDLAELGEEAPEPLALEDEGGDGFRWGARYALEGSRLGGAMLARRVAEGLPRAYLSAVHEKGGWLAFQQSLDAAAEHADDDWMDGAKRGAEAVFVLFASAARVEQALPRG